MVKSIATSRRRFVQSLGAGGVVLAGTAITQKKSYAAVGTVQYGMVIDTRKCKGCHACSVACKSEFDVPLGAVRSWVEFVEKGDYPKVERKFMPRLCNQCNEAPCVTICPVEAAYKRKEDGIVVFDQEACIACKKCVDGDDKLPGCPYDAAFMNPVTGKAQKCDFCVHRVGAGVVPSCVNTCPSRARIFGDINDPSSEISKLIAKEDAQPLYAGKGTKPNVFYIGAEDLKAPPMATPGKYLRVERNRPFSTDTA
ncbi:MAG: 4Fe-4S dicluster domain-containing protein [Rhodospirillaceae bacterium]|nr:4Fe-4S dicluster domain-containing protein [Rhodospirillaceae bacterium]MBT7485933.1 4Fe-4S dicluster domain-containing protein [Rhodospirillales bacterium]MBT4701020.1 4Fe-4S dicluster domain-containing protein [Rhodospirillaceae bacterium]MBT5033643.1 4Fe-4S dicluster domain-containing protein [Rhodospirillaceae bacterium]MBT6221522.1 4Fe-4S dicluster domain-containing protein [Rhodospirillaceae bacterium]